MIRLGLGIRIGVEVMEYGQVYRVYEDPSKSQGRESEAHSHQGKCRRFITN